MRRVGFVPQAYQLGPIIHYLCEETAHAAHTQHYAPHVCCCFSPSSHPLDPSSFPPSVFGLFPQAELHRRVSSSSVSIPCRPLPRDDRSETVKSLFDTALHSDNLNAQLLSTRSAVGEPLAIPHFQLCQQALMPCL